MIKIKTLPFSTQFKKDITSFVLPKGYYLHLFSQKEQRFTEYAIILKLNFDLRDHRYNQNINCVNPICSCGIDEKTPIHYFLWCSRYITY